MNIPKKLEVGTRVCVNHEITESGEPGDPNAGYLDGAFIHARAGETATICHVDDYGEGEYAYNLKFDRTGTVCVTHRGEFHVIPHPHAVN